MTEIISVIRVVIWTAYMGGIVGLFAWATWWGGYTWALNVSLFAGWVLAFILFITGMACMESYSNARYSAAFYVFNAVLASGCAFVFAAGSAFWVASVLMAACLLYGVAGSEASRKRPKSSSNAD